MRVTNIIMNITMIMLIVLTASNFVNAARLPDIGGDQDDWGTILNNYLSVSLDPQGYLQDAIIGTAMLMDGAITGDKIANNTITNEKIVERTITGDKIADETITGDAIQTDSVPGDRIATESITTSQIQDGSISWIDIEPGSIDGSSLGDLAIDRPSIFMDRVVTGDKIDYNSIDSKHLQTDSVYSEQIADETVQGNDISRQAEINVKSIEADTILGHLTPIVGQCSTAPAPCTVRAECPEYGQVIFGMASATSIDCSQNPAFCDTYCTPGLAYCEVTSDTGAASAYIVCSRMS